MEGRYIMEQKKYSLKELQSALQQKQPSFVVEDILSRLDKEEVVEGCLACQEAPEEIRVYSWCMLGNIGADVIAENLAVFLEALSSSKEGTRSICLNCLRRLRSEALADNLHVLIKAIHSDFFMVRFYAEELIGTINSKDLLNRKVLVISEYQLSRQSNQIDYRRVVEKLMAGVLKEFDLLDIYQNKKMLEKLSYSENEKLKEAARIDVLRMIEEDCHNNYLLRDLLPHWQFLSDCELLGSDELREKATLIKLNIVEKFPVRRREDIIDYLISLHKSAHKDIRRRSRKFVLDILEDWPKEEMFKYRNFLIRCLESKHFLIRFQAKQLIGKVRSYQWAQDIEGLLNWHLSGFNHVRRTVRRILAGLPSPYLSEKNIPALLKAQRSIDPIHRKLAAVLAAKIEPERIKKIEDVLREEATVKQKYVASLASSLLQKVS